VKNATHKIHELINSQTKDREKNNKIWAMAKKLLGNKQTTEFPEQKRK